MTTEIELTADHAEYTEMEQGKNSAIAFLRHHRPL